MSGASKIGWLEIVGDCWLLGAEASLVIPLRLARLAGGGRPACIEARRMVAEKAEAHGRLVTAIALGKHGHCPREIAGGSVHHYLGYVRANRVRLMRHAGKRR